MPDKQTTTLRITPAMIHAAQMAEYRHYYGDKNPTSHTWAGTPLMVIVKMLKAALEAPNDAG
jgi:hypothetical protein